MSTLTPSELENRKLQEEIAERVPHSILYESKNPFSKYIHRKRLNKILVFLRDIDNVLDVGCGDGYYLERINNAIGLDISRIRAKRAKERSNKQVIVATAERMPFKESCFDGILLSEVLEHLSNPKKCLAEVVSIMKKDAVAVISFPNDRNLKIGRRILYFIAVLSGDTFSKENYREPAICDHIHRITPEDIEAFLKLQKTANLPFGLPFKFSLFYIGIYKRKET